MVNPDGGFYAIKHKDPLIILLLLVGLWLLAVKLGVCINDTPSMPRGVYIHKGGKVQRGDVVLFCLVEPYKTVGIKSLYLEKGRACGGAEALIKRVIAVPHAPCVRIVVASN